jgi:tetratricopeptide (TPR) repeat protein
MKSNRIQQYSYYEKLLEIMQINLSRNHHDLALFYNNIGEVYDDIGDYSKALSFYGKVLEIFSNALSTKTPSLNIVYNSIDCVYQKLEEYSRAVSFCQRAVDIRQQP